MTTVIQKVHRHSFLGTFVKKSTSELECQWHTPWRSATLRGLTLFHVTDRSLGASRELPACSLCPGFVKGVAWIHAHLARLRQRFPPSPHNSWATHKHFQGPGLTRPPGCRRLLAQDLPWKRWCSRHQLYIGKFTGAQSLFPIPLLPLSLSLFPAHLSPGFS